MKECDNSTRKINISNNFVLSISLLIMIDTLLLRPSLHCNTPLHFTTLHYTSLHLTTLRPTTLHYTSLHFTTLHLTTLHYTPLHFTTLHPTKLHHTSLHFTTLHFLLKMQLLKLKESETWLWKQGKMVIENRAFEKIKRCKCGPPSNPRR